MRHESWPGQSNLRPDLPWDEAQALRSELYAKGRLDSISWSETESLLLRCKDTEIMNGVTAEIHSNRLSLTVEAYLRDPAIVEYLYLTFEFKDAYVSQGDDKRISIPEFLSLGEAYWEAFASRSRELASKVDTANQNIQ